MVEVRQSFVWTIVTFLDNEKICPLGKEAFYLTVLVRIL